MSEEFVCQSCEKIIVPKGDLQPVIACSDCYYRIAKSDNENAALRKQLEAAMDGINRAMNVCDNYIDVRSVLNYALAKIEQISRENGINPIIDNEDGKDGGGE